MLIYYGSSNKLVYLVFLCVHYSDTFFLCINCTINGFDVVFCVCINAVLQNSFVKIIYYIRSLSRMIINKFITVGCHVLGRVVRTTVLYWSVSIIWVVFIFCWTSKPFVFTSPAI